MPPLRRLKAKLVKRDTDGTVISTSDFVSKSAVVMDPDAETSEVIRVDQVRITAFMIDLEEGIAHVNFVLGGRDSSGVFRRDQQFTRALWSLHREQDIAAWNRFIGQRTSFQFTDLLEWVHDSGGLKAAGRNIWSLPDLESEREE